jgi:sugar phosphate isomerase/epimerase
VKVGNDHLTYSTLVHPGDTWEEMSESLATYLPKVKARVAPDVPFGVCLRLSAASAETLVANADERAKLRRFLDENDMYLYTVNAFPYGPFKGRRVKEQVYEPDWRTDERFQYTKNVASLLAELAPEDIAPSIQSAPLGFKPRVSGPDVVASYTEHVLGVVAHLVELEERTGRTVTLALEPEPLCFLETTAETIDYFGNHLYSGASAERLGELADIPASSAHGALRRHLGIVFDCCHQAIEYEDMGEALGALRDAGIPVFKLQEAAAVHVAEVTADTVAMLERYVETVYLTQTIERRDGQLRRFVGLEDAIAAWREDPSGAREWRVHFHVPVFLEELGELRSTRFAIEDALAFHRSHEVSRQLEIETYTWDVLPEELKHGDIVEYVAQELEWVRGQLTG